jgi:uncharacterized membrane protein
MVVSSFVEQTYRRQTNEHKNQKHTDRQQRVSFPNVVMVVVMEGGRLLMVVEVVVVVVVVVALIVLVVVVMVSVGLCVTCVVFYAFFFAPWV